jgi:hypothetical protein
MTATGMQLLRRASAKETGRAGKHRRKCRGVSPLLLSFTFFVRAIGKTLSKNMGTSHHSVTSLLMVPSLNIRRSDTRDLCKGSVPSHTGETSGSSIL